jgi:hypothetical protein
MYKGNTFSFGCIGAETCLLDDNLNPVTGNGYHSIDLVQGTAKIGSKTYPFTEHLKWEL